MKARYLLLFILLISSLKGFGQIDQDSLRASRKIDQDSLKMTRNTKPSYRVVQDENYKSCISLSIGGSVPTGDFAAADYNNENSGFAKPGASFDISYTYKFDINFGMCAMIKSMTNTFDADKLAMELNKHNATQTYDKITSDPWSTAAIMIGGYGTTAIDNRNKLFVDGKIMIGIAGVTYPKQEAYITTGGNSYYGEFDELNGSAIGFEICGGLHYNISKRFMLLVSADYFACKANFAEQQYANGNTQPAFSQKISMFNVSGGVGYYFR